MPIIGIQSSAGMKPNTPTIGTATDGGTGTTASVAFTPSTYIGKGTITYTATSSPGSITATGAASPITVSGLTTGTAYTFTVNGTTNYGVTSDSSAASNSVTPASPSSFESIATVTAAGGETSLSFTSIPSTYKSLQIRGIAKDNYSVSANAQTVNWQFNSDTGSNYVWHYLDGNGSAASAGALTGAGNIATQYGVINSYSTLANMYGVNLIDIHDYASTSKYKTLRSVTGENANGLTANHITLTSGLWLSTAAINTITMLRGTGFAAGSTFALYGIK